METNTTNLGFEKQIWDAACLLRGNIDASEYKHVILGLIFLKYISDSFESRYAELCEDGDGFEEDKDAYLEKGIFFVPEGARWSDISKKAHEKEIGVCIDNAMREIEKENPRLKDVLSKNYARPELDKRRLGDVVDLITNIKMLDHSNEKDILGRTYEYCLAMFAEQEGRLAGEFYTPSCVVRTLVEVLQPFNGRVYDPCCGSGGMFVQSARFIENHNGNIDNISVFGQDSNPTTWKLAQMNLAIRGIEADLGHYNADTFTEDQHPTLRADYIMANPPFNLKTWGAESLGDDVRWKYGVPSKNNANYAWIQHMIYHLAPFGKMGMVLANTALSIESEPELSIRKNIIEDDLVECIVSLPASLFYSTKIKVSLWFITKKKKRSGHILFIDARKLGSLSSRTFKEFSEEDILKIANTVHRFQDNSGYENEEMFCYDATLSEVREKKYNLSPTRYICGEIEVDDVGDFESDYAEDFEKLNTLKDEVRLIKSNMTQLLASHNNYLGDMNLYKEVLIPDFTSLSLSESNQLLENHNRLTDIKTSIATLAESIMYKLFKYWFVEFNFADENGNPYALSGGDMRKTTYGYIPKDWTVIQFKDILTPSKEKVNDMVNVPEYSVTNRGIFPRTDKFVKSLTSNSSKNRLVRRGDIVFGMSREILNFGVMLEPIGSVSPAYHVYSVDKEIYNSEFLEIYMRTCSEYFLSLIKPGAREGQGLDKDELMNKQLICPPLEVQNMFILTKNLLVELLCKEL